VAKINKAALLEAAKKPSTLKLPGKKVQNKISSKVLSNLGVVGREKPKDLEESKGPLSDADGPEYESDGDAENP
jgi:hypothetical protein